jgi:glycosyltransferase involved in cell wall biosynthesis
LKVCVVAHTGLTTDARVMLEAECLAERGDSLTIMCLRDHDEPEYEDRGNIHIHRILKSTEAKNPLSILIQLTKFFIVSFFWISYSYYKERYDILHVHTVPDFEIFAAIVPKLNGAKLVLDMHEIMPELYSRKFKIPENNWIIRLITLVEKASLGFADHVIVATPFLKSTLIQRSTNRDKCTAIINLPNPKYFNNVYKDRSAGMDRFRLIYPGTLSELHGVDVVIKALKILKDRNLFPIEFHIYGEGPDRGKIASLVESLGLKDVVFFQAPVPFQQLADIYRSMDAGIVAKRAGIFADEAMSTKLFEYAAAGLPAIVSRTRGDSLYFDDSMVCFFEPENERQLADCIVRLQGDPQYRELLSKNSMSVFVKVSWKALSEEIRVIFDRLHGG